MSYSFTARADNAIKCSGTGFFKAGPPPPPSTVTAVQFIQEGLTHKNLLATDVEIDGDWLFASECGEFQTTSNIYIYKWNGSGYTKTQTLTGGANYGSVLDVRNGHAVIMGQQDLTEFWSLDTQTDVWSMDMNITFGDSIKRFPETIQYGGKYCQLSDNGTVAALIRINGTVRIYRYSNGTWTLDGGAEFSLGFGVSYGITLSGDGTRFAALHPNTTDQSKVTLWEYTNPTWNHLQTITQDAAYPNSTSGRFRDAQLNEDGSFLCISQNDQSVNVIGHIFFWQETSANTWTLVQTVADSNATSWTGDFLGNSIDWDPVNSRFVIADYVHSYSTTAGDAFNKRIGQVYIYEYQNGQWVIRFTVDPPGTLATWTIDLEFGSSISLYGDRLVVAAAREKAPDGTTWVGALHVYTVP